MKAAIHLLLARITREAEARETDVVLLSRFVRDRDESAFAALLDRHARFVWCVCRGLLLNEADAEDAFQATFVALFRGAARIRHQESLAPWLHATSTRIAKKVRLAAARRMRRESRVARPESAPTISSEETWEELNFALHEEIDRLPERLRVAFVLCVLEGRRHDETARQLGVPVGTLWARVSRARKTILDRLSARGLTPAVALSAGMAGGSGLAPKPTLELLRHHLAEGFVAVPKSILDLAAAGGGISMTVKWITTALLLAILTLGLGTVWFADAQEKPRATTPEEKPAASAPAPHLVPGRWLLVEWLAPGAPQQVAVLTVGVKDGAPAIMAIEGDPFEWKPGRLTVAGRRVTFTITREGPLEQRFDGLFDPANPKRVLGSFASPGGRADRAVLEWIAPGVPARIRKPALPAEWQRYLELAIAEHQARLPLDSPGFGARTPAEQAALRAEAARAGANYWAEVPGAFRKLMTDQPDSSFGFEAAMELIKMVDRLKPAAGEIDSWATTARAFAARHGPQMEADTVGRITTNLMRRPEYAGLARKYAREADGLAKTAGVPATHLARMAEHDVERAAWAAQAKPPAADAVWTVTLTGRVTDARGQPIPGVEVLVNNTQWVKTLTKDGSYKARTGADGDYTITLRCQGSNRVHVTRMWATKKGYIRGENTERHRLLPGKSATVHFVLARGEPFGGTLKLRPDVWERQAGAGKGSHLLQVVGPGVDELVVVPNGGRFEVSLPAGRYRVILKGGKKDRLWPNLATGRIDHVFEEPTFRFTRESVGSGFDQMWKAMDRSYSYFTLAPGTEWAKLREEYRPRAVEAKSAEELATVLVEMLARLKDGHVWIEMPDGKVIGTHRSSWSYNGNRKVILAQLTETTECGDYALVGKTRPDGFGYFLMKRQSSATPDLVARAVAAIEKLADAPGFIVDLRTANGGSEPLAQEVARLFCGKKVLYARSRFRDGRQHDQFTEDQPRYLTPARSGRPFLGPVVCLLGPGCVSSGEGFAKMMAALPQVTTVGLATGGSSGNPGPVEVGETGIVVYFSRWVDLMPNGMPVQGKGVPPKVCVERPASEYRGADPTLARGLELLRMKR